MKRVVLGLAAMAISLMIRSHAVAAVCSLVPSVATQERVINPDAEVGGLRQEPAIAVIEHHAESLGDSQTLRRVEIASQDSEVAVTIYMPVICAE